MKTLGFIFIFFASTSAVTFNCKFTEAQWLAIGLNYQCQTKPSDVETSQFVTSISGDHWANKTIDDVKAIHISNCTDLTYIPKGLLKFFPNLTGIYLEECGISSLNGTELYEYPQLQVLALEKSSLKYVPGDLFSQTPNMVLISFNENKINGTGRNLLSNLTKLSEVYFEKNVCIDKNATKTEEIRELIDTLNKDCAVNDGDSSTASEMFISWSLILLLSALAYAGKYQISI